MANETKLEVVAVRSFEFWEQMYQVVDFLNRTLKDHNLVFGLSKDDQKMTLTIYETRIR